MTHFFKFIFYLLLIFRFVFVVAETPKKEVFNSVSELFYDYTHFSSVQGLVNIFFPYQVLSLTQ